MSILKLSDISRDISGINKFIKFDFGEYNKENIKSQYECQEVSHLLHDPYVNFKISNGIIVFVIPQIKDLNKYFLSAQKKNLID